ncbi:rhodanese-like domain-containing protein [Sulfurovum sp. XGS-02]|uniref:rhodanese-like domain-containing protein n=1 Tax=Sulfurovum sp. XGS-02 TaxID=2925411 RepID=UPI0020509E2B|nr:rhodanese-like domain-containing protein [Sulfurovum sp. XGS-02]UPT77957.1 rhodanese-like domain-containing protein [Sulfurovum sp. XGS-02]
MQELLEKDDINSEELEILLEARDEGKVDFLLVDVREEMEYDMGHIKGVDMLKPTTAFQQWAQAFFDETKEKKVIFTCRTGSRSGQVQHVFKQHGHTGAVNHFGGIVTYQGEIEK